MRTLVVLGTGTDVGKTYVSVRLASLLTRETQDLVSAIKPLETGVTPDARTDATKLGAASRPILPQEYAHSFRPPISPHLAARDAGVEIRAAEVASWVRSRACNIRDGATEFALGDHWVIVETAGGVFSPTSDTETNLDIARALEPSCWLLVAADKLGVLHAVRSTTLAMRQMARAPDIVLLSAPAEPDASTGLNRAELERLGWARVVASIGRDQDFEPAQGRSLISLLRNPLESTPKA